MKQTQQTRGTTLEANINITAHELTEEEMAEIEQYVAQLRRKRKQRCQPYLFCELTFYNPSNNYATVTPKD